MALTDRPSLESLHSAHQEDLFTYLLPSASRYVTISALIQGLGHPRTPQGAGQSSGGLGVARVELSELDEGCPLLRPRFVWLAT